MLGIALDSGATQTCGGGNSLKIAVDDNQQHQMRYELNRISPDSLRQR
ncbi:hypothetical protein SAMN02745781_00442 [Vibrio gazogenes DSM 21264]|uniref:Uncharacterized protein n=1 Tax=Vibrio gazogenes DSM 21264 = NBRC 103151 TaxID=1123492 RepID=A0A1M4U1D9_VIBGA|nr:hypothetical protein SAMN02745781_00442 [Vibrio gazogenes DSM 21264] [Vibrio gazogenes DSM 21264 = NBRC 103151]SJN53121.1 hypothetical protein BQ6471_00268 [Vibrio gazogenes]